MIVILLFPLNIVFFPRKKKEVQFSKFLKHEHECSGAPNLLSYWIRNLCFKMEMCRGLKISLEHPFHYVNLHPNANKYIDKTLYLSFPVTWYSRLWVLFWGMI
jgi:hypothetical protein